MQVPRVIKVTLVYRALKVTREILVFKVPKVHKVTVRS